MTFAILELGKALRFNQAEQAEAYRL